MNYTEAMDMIDWLNKRFKQGGLKPWYRWAVDIDWKKVCKWAKMLGYEDWKEIKE